MEQIIENAVIDDAEFQIIKSRPPCMQASMQTVTGMTNRLSIPVSFFKRVIKE